MAKRPGRQKSQLPTCYFEGYLEKRSFKDKTSRKLWACLCGKTLFFFNDKRDTDYVEKLDLSGFLSIADDGSQDRNLDAARINLQMKDGITKFTAPSAEARELWKGYIHSVAELSVPSSLNLLPGQILALKMAVEEEKERTQSAPLPPIPNPNPYIRLKADMPACYHNVTRMEAELLLEREAKRGNLLLRPREGNSFAVTTRQDHDGSVFKHYIVSRKYEGGFVIEVDDPVFCATLHDVINHMVTRTEGVLIPLTMEKIYDRRISFVWSDRENGEKSIQEVPVNPVPPAVPPKPVPRIPSPEPAPTPAPAPEQDEMESIYLNFTLEQKEKEAEDSSEVTLQPPKKAMMPPTPLPRKWSHPPAPPLSTSPSINQDSKMRPHQETTAQIPFAILPELKLVLQQKVKCQE